MPWPDATSILEQVTLIPQPRSLHAGQTAARIGSIVPSALPAAFATLGRAIASALVAMEAGAGGGEAEVRFAVEAGSPESYRLVIRDGRVEVHASDARGALHALRTLADLWSQSRPWLPDVEIVDAPTFAHRGIFAESAWGSDRMSLDDWCGFIDRLAGLKLNVLGISLYGCWDLRYPGDTSEFLFAPLADFPQLRSPHSMRTWDPVTRQVVTLDDQPRMFTEDLLGRVVTHARGQGVSVIPVLGGPGHSSLIPRLVPELAARAREGSPAGYGYCVSDPLARTTLGRLFANVVDQHVVPNGLDVLGCAGDEFYPIANMDPDNPLRVVSPYCDCPGCSLLTPAEQLMEYLTIAARVLAGRGVRMLLWHDSLVRMGVLDRLADRLRAEGLPLPTVSWWAYHDPLPEVTPGFLETWVTPSPAFIGTLFGQDLGLNIEAWARAGSVAGATGILGYNVPDPAIHRGYALLADLAWNLEGSGGSSAFHARWAARLAPDRTDEARFALEQADSILRCYPLMTYLVDHLMPYFSTSPRGVVDFPMDQVRAFLPPSPAMTGILRQVRDTLRDAMRRMPPTRSIRGWPDPGPAWTAQLVRIADHVELFRALVEAARRARSLDPPSFATTVADLEAAGARLLEHVATTSAPYLAPALLREHLALVEGIRPTLERFRSSDEAAPLEPWHAWLI